MSNKVKTCPVENCRAKGGPANCRYHSGVLLYYASQVRKLPKNKRDNSLAYMMLSDYGNKFIKWYDNNKKRAAKNGEPAYDKGTPVSSEEDVKKLYNMILEIVPNPLAYEEFTGARIINPLTTQFNENENDNNEEMINDIHKEKILKNENDFSS